MRLVLHLLPIITLVAYSQVAIKWRMDLLRESLIHENRWNQLIHCLTDPYIFSAYVSGLIGSFVWIFVVAKFPLAVAFPVYIGLTFIAVVLGSALFLQEAMTLWKLCGIGLIIAGVVIIGSFE